MTNKHAQLRKKERQHVKFRSNNPVGPGTKPYVESMYAFFKRSRFLNALGYSGASLFAFAMTLEFVRPVVGITYLVIHQLLMLLLAIVFYSKWTNARLDECGLPKYAMHANFLAKTFLPCLLFMELDVNDSHTFCLAMLVVVLGCSAGSMVTLGPLKKLARQDLICSILPTSIACFYFGHLFVALGTLFFLSVVAYAGLDEMHKTYLELIGLRVKSLNDAEVLDISNGHLKTAIKSLEKEAQRRLAIEKDREKLQASLITASRKAGKAEIATGVLHNVGNVMNSVNVSSSILQDNLQNELQNNLASAVDLLESHRDDLGGFFQKDNRATHFLPFMRDLNQQAVFLLDEVQELRSSIDHVNSVVAAQQSYATSVGLISKVDLVEVVNSALQIVSEDLRQSRITVIRQFPASCNVSMDHQKLIQILVNLVTNSKHAINEQSPVERKLKVLIQQSESDDMFLISVADNGVGISPENLSKIFQHGFSTRKGRGGHGFGLHHSALMLKEMGGELKVTSKGIGLGAVFNIWIPSHESTDQHDRQNLNGIDTSTKG